MVSSSLWAGSLRLRRCDLVEKGGERKRERIIGKGDVLVCIEALSLLLLLLLLLRRRHAIHHNTLMQCNTTSVACSMHMPCTILKLTPSSACPYVLGKRKRLLFQIWQKSLLFIGIDMVSFPFFYLPIWVRVPVTVAA